MAALLSTHPIRPEIVVTFLASLELARLKKLRVHQEGTYQAIYLELLESLKDFRFELATGFTNEAELAARAAAAGATAEPPVSDTPPMDLNVPLPDPLLSATAAQSDPLTTPTDHSR